jgi:hypothetical protein
MGSMMDRINSMKATFAPGRFDNGRMRDGEKEQIGFACVVATRNGRFAEPVTVRWWMGRSRSASVVYCSVWIHGAGEYRAGSGQAGGYGYHKRSAALGAAIRSAGVSLTASISGVGESAEDAAMRAIARALGYRKFTIVRG